MKDWEEGITIASRKETQVTDWMKEENLSGVVKHPGSCQFVLRASQKFCIDMLLNNVDKIEGLCDCDLQKGVKQTREDAQTCHL